MGPTSLASPTLCSIRSLHGLLIARYDLKLELSIYLSGRSTLRSCKFLFKICSVKLQTAQRCCLCNAEPSTHATSCSKPVLPIKRDFDHWQWVPHGVQGARVLYAPPYKIPVPCAAPVLNSNILSLDAEQAGWGGGRMDQRRTEHAQEEAVDKGEGMSMCTTGSSTNNWQSN
jgi:hypothetical protein